MKKSFKACAYASVVLSAAMLVACDQQDSAKKAAEATPAAAVTTPIETDAPAGTYTLDHSHASLTFKVNHLGFSHYTARFTNFDATLQGDPKDPATAALSATIDAKSLELPTPPAGFKDELLGPQWLDAGKYPEITFKSTAVEVTSPNTAHITGDFTLHGVTKPVVLNATFNGGYAGHPMDPHARIGFSADTAFKRSDFGIAYGVPAPGTTLGVSDEVQVSIEAEFNGPALASSTTPPAQ